MTWRSLSSLARRLRCNASSEWAGHTDLYRLYLQERSISGLLGMPINGCFPNQNQASSNSTDQIMLSCSFYHQFRNPENSIIARRFTSIPNQQLSSENERQEKSTTPPPPTGTEEDPKERSKQALTALDEALSKLERSRKAAKKALLNFSTIPSRVKAYIDLPRQKKIELAKSQWQSIREAAHHTWVGLKLFVAEVQIASGLALKNMRGEQLSRRERNQLKNTTADIFRMIPFSFFIIVPFMEVLLPVALYFFPQMLPSTFQTEMKKEEQRKNRVKLRLKIAEFFFDTFSDMAQNIESKKPGDDKVATARELREFMANVRKGEVLDNDLIKRFAKLFNNELTLDNLPRQQLVSMCQYMGLQPYGTNGFLRYQLRSKLAAIKDDDLLIRREGIDSLSIDELRSANRARGMPCLGVTESMLKKQLHEWLALSLDAALPSSLLILSRAFTYVGMSKVASTEQALQATLSTLPEKAVEEIERESQAQDQTSTLAERLERVKEAQEAIEEEREAAEREKMEALEHGQVAEEIMAVEDSSRKQQVKDVMEALSMLASTSFVCKEREALLELARRETDFVKGLLDETQDRIASASTTDDEEDGDKSADEKFSISLCTSLKSMLKRAEAELDAIDESVGDKMKVLDLDNDGLVSAEEVTAALKKLKMNMTPEQIVDVLDKMKFDSDGMSALREIMKGIETESEDQLEFGQNLWRARLEERKVIPKEPESVSS